MLIRGVFFLLVVLLGSFAPLSDLPPIVFVSRNPSPAGLVSGIAPVGRTAKPGGKLLIRERSGKIRRLAAALYDVADATVSFDATRVLFSGLVHPDSSWRIFEIGVDGTGFKQLTFTTRAIDLSQFGDLAKTFERYDDFDPCYLPDGKIIFASTRYPSLAPFGKTLTSNLFSMTADGANLHRITTERHGAEEPAVDGATGRIVFSRWWLNIDLPSNQSPNGLTRNPSQALTDDVGNLWHAITAKPDGDELKLYAGFPRRRSGLQAYKPVVMQNGDLLCVFHSTLSLQGDSDTIAIRRFKKGASLPVMLSPANALAVDAVELSANQILYSEKPKGATFGLYWVDTLGMGRKKILDLPNADELDAAPIVKRPLPPVLKDEFEVVSDIPPIEEPAAYYENHAFRFDCLNIFANGKVDEPMPDAPKMVKAAKVRFYMNIQRQNGEGLDAALLIKETPIDFDGSIRETNAPAEAPLFEQLIDSEGKILTTSSGKIAHVSGLNAERKGAGTKCVGCHTGHTLIEAPLNGSYAQWFNAATSATLSASSERRLEGELMSARRAVDRQVKLGADTTVWIASEEQTALLNLKWSMPIIAREAVLYGASSESRFWKKFSVKNGRIELFYRSEKIREVPFDEALTETGYAISLGDVKIDEARLTLMSDKMPFGEPQWIGLGEVEIRARIAE